MESDYDVANQCAGHAALATEHDSVYNQQQTITNKNSASANHLEPVHRSQLIACFGRTAESPARDNVFKADLGVR